MAKERPILFSGSMVRAILDGRKTQTRRVLKDRFWDIQSGPENCMNGFRRIDGGCAVFEIQDTVDSTHEYKIRCPYGVPGDTLWVRECWGTPDADHPQCVDGRKPQQGDHMVYRANPADDYQWGSGLPSQGGFVWRPSIHMPRWASRITLEVTDVRIERVQEISVDDAIAEGVWLDPPDAHGFRSEVQGAFRELWDSINAKRGFGWEANPWVWALAFKRIN